jgi:hypothetical protein
MWRPTHPSGSRGTKAVRNLFLGLLSEVGMKTFFKVRKSEIRKFVGSFHNHKFLWCASPQIANPKIVMIYDLSAKRKSANLYKILHNFVSIRYSNRLYKKICFYFEQMWIRTLYAIQYTVIVRRKSMYLGTCGRNHWICKSHICRMLHFRKLRRSKELFEFANLRICDWRNLFGDCPRLFFRPFQSFSARDTCRHNHEEVISWWWK